MKFVRIIGLLWVLIPCVSFGAGSSDFQNASNLLKAARRGDARTMQILINAGADVNYVDSTGLSLVCTAVMNNDRTAIQMLQAYGADASKCDRQIKQYRQRAKVAAGGEDYNFFSGLSSSHVIALSALAAVGVIGGVALLTKAFDSDDGNSSSPSGGSHSGGGGGGGGGGGTTTTYKLFDLNLPYGPACSDGTCPENFSIWENSEFIYGKDFSYMSNNGFNYLMVAHAYNSFVRGYLGMRTIRIAADKSPFDLTNFGYYPDGNVPGGGKPVNVAMITATGVSATGSVADDLIPWIDVSQITSVQTACATNPTSTECLNATIAATKTSHKYYNLSGATVEDAEETTAFKFDLVDGLTVFGSETETEGDTKLAKIIAGWAGGERAVGDFYGFIPNGQLTVYKVGTGSEGVSDYKNYAAINSALHLTDTYNNFVVDAIVNLSLPTVSSQLNYPTLSSAKMFYDAASNAEQQKYNFGQIIDNYYNLNQNDDTGASAVNKPSTDANLAYTTLGLNRNMLLINSAGYNVIDVDDYSVNLMEATFENFAPVVYSDLQNLFMTVVAVGPANGTSGQTIEDYTAAGAGKLELSVWNDQDDSTITYSSRMCGLAGTGNDGAMNPWCFAAPGATALEATASMAGAVALVKSAFDYMSADQIFLLLALTADGPYLGTNPETDSDWTSEGAGSLVYYLQEMYTLPSGVPTSDEQYLESFKNVFGYGMINLERATKPGKNVYFYDPNKKTIAYDSKTAYWRNASSAAFNLAGRGAITASYYDVIESADGTLSLPRVWTDSFSLDNVSKHGLYMGDVLGDFNVGTTNTRTNQFGNMTIDMAMSSRAYNDNMNGLDNLRVAFSNEKFDLDAQYQHYLTDGESRFSGRANGVLALASNSVASGAAYKFGKFAFGGRAFSGAITDESLLENDPAISNQFEPGRLGFVNGASFDAKYSGEKFGFNVAFGTMHEDNTVLGSVSSGLLALNGADTKYVDTVAIYKPFENVKLSLRGTFANTHANLTGGLISEISDIKSNAFAFGADIGGFSFTAAMPLATVGGHMGYGYADFDVVENGGSYEVAMNNAHMEYIDLAQSKRELRFSTYYKQPVGEFTDAGVGLIYRVHPNNTDMFGNESILMFKIQHRLGI